MIKVICRRERPTSDAFRFQTFVPKLAKEREQVILSAIITNGKDPKKMTKTTEERRERWVSTRAAGALGAVERGNENLGIRRVLQRVDKKNCKGFGLVTRVRAS